MYVEMDVPGEIRGGEGRWREVKEVKGVKELRANWVRFVG